MRFALITSFIFGCWCFKNETYRELEENALCVDGKTIVCDVSSLIENGHINFNKTGADVSLTTLNNFRGRAGLVRLKDDTCCLINSTPRFIYTDLAVVDSSAESFSDDGEMQASDWVADKILQYYQLNGALTKQEIIDFSHCCIKLEEFNQFRYALDTFAYCADLNSMESKFAIVHFKNGLIFIVNKQVQFVDETGRVVGGQESKDAFDKLYKDANPNTGDDKWPLDPKDLFKSKMSELDQSKVLPKEWLLKYYGDRQGIRLNEFTNAALEKALKNPEMVPIKLITEGEFAIVSYQTPKGKNLILIVNSTPQFVDTQKMPSIIAQSAAVFSRIFVVQEKPDQFVVNQIAKSLIPNCPQVDFEFVATSFVFLQPKHT